MWLERGTEPLDCFLVGWDTIKDFVLCSPRQVQIRLVEGAGEKAQQAKVLAKPEDLSSVSGTHIVDGEKQLLQGVFCPLPEVLWQVHPTT